MANWQKELMTLANDFCLNMSKAKDIVSIFVSEYIKAKEKKDERKDKGNN